MASRKHDKIKAFFRCRRSESSNITAPPPPGATSTTIIRLPETPLPELPKRLQGSPSILAAYPQILSLERNEQAAYNRNRTDDQRKRLIYARIIGYLILEGPSDNVRTAVALEVNSCDNEQDLLAIGQHYCDHYIRAFRKYKVRTPTSSPHVSRLSFNTYREMIMHMVVDAPQNHTEAKKNALVRDGFRCVITGLYDIDSVVNNDEIRRDAATAEAGPTECAHIFSESTSGSGAQGDKYAAGLWAVLRRFGYQKILDELDGAKINRLENAFTLHHDPHHYFDTLRIWFEPIGSIDKPNTYKLCAAHPAYIRSGWKRTVTFTTTDPIKLPVPSREYLELHAACCRVAHLSGAAEHIEKILRDMDDIQVLSQDGTSAEALRYALLPLQSPNPSPLRM